MIDIEKKYYLREIAIKINKRILTYDWDDRTVYYAYNGINKQQFKLDLDKWDKVCTKYKLWKDYSFCKYEEISR